MYLYLHVPFCVSKCIYCDFYVVLSRYGGQDAYVDAVCREIELRFSRIDPNRWPEGIRTLYVGGGTPSLLSASDYRRVFATLNRYLPFAPNAEITLEANPGARKSEMADSPEAYLKAGFNRVSVGIQSLNDPELKKLSRIHSAQEAEDFVARLKTAGWGNISVDLMYGIPLQTMESWWETLQKVIALDVQHVSMYGLKVEEQTPLERLVRVAGAAYPLPEEDAHVEMYFEGLKMLAQAGFQRYEFSNLAKPGFASRHNLNYWDNGPFLALGASAHGYWDNRRYENVRDLQQYLLNPLAGESLPCPPEEQLENAIIFGLRKAEGIDIPALERQYNIDFRSRYAGILAKYMPEFLILKGEHLMLNEQAIPLSNTILAEFLESV
ncbi:MAG TPA: radical SAM family heme chaperone HemW [Coleofasciculaceae cyanobacterium]|jgi:oxygen-independent coproporphyrinogen-3 oxidase